MHLQYSGIWEMNDRYINRRVSNGRQYYIGFCVVQFTFSCLIIICWNTSPVAVLDRFQVILTADFRQRRRRMHLFSFNLYVQHTWWHKHGKTSYTNSVSLFSVCICVYVRTKILITLTTAKIRRFLHDHLTIFAHSKMFELKTCIVLTL